MPQGVSRESCGECRSWLRAHARSHDVTHVVDDGRFTRVYHPDGSVDVHDSNTGTHLRRVAGDSGTPIGGEPNPPGATRFDYEGRDW